METTETVELEIWIAIDADGGYEVGTDLDDADERLDERSGSAIRRHFGLVLTLPSAKPPVFSAELISEAAVAQLRLVKG